MAKAVFQKHQRVFVKPVGVWAAVEQVKPQWVKDVGEPVRVFYDCGLGRDFTADELAAEAVHEGEAGRWRLMRAKNKWQTPDECAHHPYPGTFPVVVTDEQDWGGWRVPGAEYDRNPAKLEFQARLIVRAPEFMELTESLARLADEGADLPLGVRELASKAKNILREVRAQPDGGKRPGVRAA